MKKMVFGLVGGVAILSSALLSQPASLSNDFSQSIKEESTKISNSRTTEEVELTLDSVVADINMVTINYSVTGAYEDGTALYIYDENYQPIAYDSHLSGSLIIKNLDYNAVYSGWIASLNFHWTIYDQKQIADFQPLKEHLINSLSVTDVETGNTDSIINYTIDTNIPLKNEIRIDVKDESDNVVATGLESNLKGSIKADGLEEDTLYKGWKIIATDINYLSVNSNSIINSFITETHFFVKELSVTNTKVEPTSVMLGYKVSSNVESENLVINLLDNSDNVVATVCNQN